MRKNTVDMLANYVEALHPVIYIKNFDFKVIDDAISRIDPNVKCVEFNNALGLINFKTKAPMEECDLEGFLRLVIDEGYDQQTFIILKDIHSELKNPKIIALLKRIAEKALYDEDYYATIFIISEVTVDRKSVV